MITQRTGFLVIWGGFRVRASLSGGIVNVAAQDPDMLSGTAGATIGHGQPGPDGIQACDKILSVTKAMAVNVGVVAACSGISAG